MQPQAYATGGGLPDVIQLLLDTHIDLALTTYGNAAYRPTSRHNWPAGPPCDNFTCKHLDTLYDPKTDGSEGSFAHTQCAYIIATAIFLDGCPSLASCTSLSKSWVTMSNAKGRSDLQAAKTLIPRQPSCSRYATSDWCGLPAASSFPRHWRRCSDCQRGKYVRRSLDADGCRDQYHKRKPLHVAFSAVHRISCCNPPPSQVSVSRCVPCQDSSQNLSQNREEKSTPKQSYLRGSRALIELRFIKFRLISRVYQLEPALNLRESHCLSPDSTTSATPLGDPWVRPCAVPCLAGGPSPDILAPFSLALPWEGVPSHACSGGS